MAEETFFFYVEKPVRFRPPPTSSRLEKETFFAINIGSKNTYLAVLDPGSDTPKLINKFPTEVIITNQVDKQDIDPRDHFSGFFRLFGRKFDDPIVQKEKEKALYKIIKGPKGDAWVETSYGKQCSISELLEKFLLKMQRASTSYLAGTIVDKFSITFPCRILKSEMDEIQNIALESQRRGFKGGLYFLFLHEFCGAAFSYGIDKRKGLFAIVDLGARTLDFTIYISPVGNPKRYDFSGLDELGRKYLMKNGMYTTKGIPQIDMYLGGDDFDNAIIKYLVSEFKSMEGIDLVEDTRLRKVAEEAKIALSSSLETEINVPNITIDSAGGSKDLKIILTREKFESLVSHLADRITKFCEKGLKKAGITAKDVTDLVLVGGMANVPLVKRVLTEVFGKSPMGGVVHEEAVALGATKADTEGCVGCQFMFDTQ
ncbi:hypothetical protein ACHQM5_023774 [Ranunculus cassubicifolius]